jgi:hypothetical protein
MKRPAFDLPEIGLAIGKMKLKYKIRTFELLEITAEELTKNQIKALAAIAESLGADFTVTAEKGAVVVQIYPKE